MVGIRPPTRYIKSMQAKTHHVTPFATPASVLSAFAQSFLFLLLLP